MLLEPPQVSVLLTRILSYPSFTLQASRDSLHSSVNGLAPGGEPSPAKGPDGTNIRDSALHDPFAQFNSLRSSNEVRLTVPACAVDI